MERKIFGFGSAASGLQKERHLNYIILSLFSLSLAAARRAPVSAFSGSSSVRSHFAITSHRPLAFARAACSVLTSCSLSDFGGVRGNSLCLPHPPSARTNLGRF